MDGLKVKSRGAARTHDHVGDLLGTQSCLVGIWGGVQNEKIGAISLSRLDQDGKTGSLAANDLRRFVSATVAPTCCRALILNQRG